MLAILFSAFFLLLFINLPVAFAIGFSSMLALNFYGDLPFSAIVTRMYSGVDSFTLLAIPFFIAAGEIMNESGITDKIVSFSKNLVGHIKGGLAHVSIVSSMFFSGISGSATADASALGSMLIPAMKKSGIDTDFAVSVSASSSAIGPIIPPSILFVIYGSIANVSIAKLFLGGVIPGLLIGFGLMLVTYFYAKKRGYPSERRASLVELLKSFLDSLVALMMPVIILGGIFGGVVTATEGAGLAVVASLVIGFIYKEIDFKRLYESATEGAIQTASVMLLVAASVLLGEFLTIEQIPQKVAESIIDFTNNKYAVLGILNIFLLIIGFFLHSVAAIILTVPIVMPLVNAVGIDPVHFGIIVTLNLAIGQQTPPVASVLVTACSVAKADIWDVTRSNISFICVLLILLLLVTYVPAIPMTLVEYFYRS